MTVRAASIGVADLRRPARRSRSFRCRPISSVSPSPVAAGNFTLTVNGVGFTAGSVVSFDGAALATTFVSRPQLRATGNAPAAKPSVPVVVDDADGEVSNTFLVDVVAPAAGAITISPTAPPSGCPDEAIHRDGPEQLEHVGDLEGERRHWRQRRGRHDHHPAPIGRRLGAEPAVVTVSATAVADPTKTATASVTIVRKVIPTPA